MATFDSESPFRSRPRMRRETFERVLHDAGSPWAAKAGALYDLIEGAGHDPAVWLAICGREHSFGTNQNSVLHRNQTNSWTNARSIRHPNIQGEIITDALRGGPYVRYRSVEDSLRDGMYRVDDPNYVYQRRGADTISEVLAIWTESQAAGYIAYVVARLYEWAHATGQYGFILPGMADVRERLDRRKPGKVPAGPFDALPLHHKRGLVVHYSGPPVRDRANTLAVLQAEARYHVWKDWASPGEGPLHGDGLMYHVAIGDDGVLYLCRDLEAVLWHCGDTKWNRHALSVHIPIGGEQQATPAQISRLRDLVDAWLGWTGQGRDALRGHQELSPTACPGTLMAGFVRPYRAGLLQSDPESRWFPETGHLVGGAFWQFWRAKGGLPIFGYPLSDELDEPCEDGQTHTVQYFERAVFEWHPDAPDDWKVQLRRLGAEELGRRAA